MVAFSSLRAAFSGTKSLLSPSGKGLTNIISKTNGSPVFVRQMGGGGGGKMIIRPSQWEYTQWKDEVHFYTMLALVPMAILVTTINVFIGRAELADVPEEYEPKHWEYHQHPISRFFSKYLYANPQRDYEKMLHLINYENEKRKFRQLEHRVKELMAQRGDYKGWYYIPVNERKTYLAREVADEAKRNSGFR